MPGFCVCSGPRNQESIRRFIKCGDSILRVSLNQYTKASNFTMPVESPIVTEGKIVTVLPGTMFRVELANQHLVLAHISGKMRKRFIRLTAGERVKLEIASHHLGKPLVVYPLASTLNYPRTF